MSWIQTYTGRAVDVLAFEPADFDIEDVAHHLSMLCRYNGAVRKFYSVAEHCVLLSHAVAPENALWALLHDATEAYVGDMVWPLKNEIPEFEVIEGHIMSAIAARVGLVPAQPAEVKEYDRRIVLDERAALLREPERPWSALEGKAPLGLTIYGWPPHIAEYEYNARFRQLTTHTDGQET